MKTEKRENGITYLADLLTAWKRTDVPRYGRTVDGYSVRSGAPTGVMVKVAGERRWRRLMCWQFSNAGTCFLRVGGKPIIVPEHLLPSV